MIIGIILKIYYQKIIFQKYFLILKKENVTDKQIKRIKEYMNKDEVVYNTKRIYEMNNIFTYLFEWIVFIIKYKEHHKDMSNINNIISSNKIKKKKNMI